MCECFRGIRFEWLLPGFLSDHTSLFARSALVIVSIALAPRIFLLKLPVSSRSRRLFSIDSPALWSGPPETSASPLCIAIVGQDPFGPVLDQVLRGKFIDSRPFVVKRFRVDQVPVELSNPVHRSIPEGINCAPSWSSCRVFRS